MGKRKPFHGLLATLGARAWQAGSGAIRSFRTASQSARASRGTKAGGAHAACVARKDRQPRGKFAITPLQLLLAWGVAGCNGSGIVLGLMDNAAYAQWRAGCLNVSGGCAVSAPGAHVAPSISSISCFANQTTDVPGDGWCVDAGTLRFAGQQRRGEPVVRWGNGEKAATFATMGAFAWRHMDIDGQHYVAVANHRDNTWSYTIDSAVYRWAPSSVEWQEHQRLRTTGAIDLEHMVIGGQHYLAVANHYDGSSFAVNSIVYRWSEALLAWEEHQSIPTIGATDWLHIEVDGSHFLVVANSGADALRGGPSVDSIVFQWESSLLRWEVHQRIATKGARDWEHMVIDGQHYLAVANSYDGTTRAVDSVVYRWSSATLAWVEHQRIPTLGARDWQFVDTGIQQYLAVANYFDGVSYSVDSVIYVWSPVALAWQVHQSIRTDGAWDWEHMLVGGLHI